MESRNIHENSIVDSVDREVHEAAPEYPAHYRTLNRAPRQQHPYWSFDDIRMQPERIRAVLELPEQQFEELADILTARFTERFLFCGVGSSLNLAMSAAHAMWRIAARPAGWQDSSEALLGEAVLESQGTAVIGLSASGNILEVVEHIRKARLEGALTLAFVNQDQTRLAQAAEYTWVDPGGYGLIWDYTSRLTAIIRLAITLGRRAEHPQEAEAIASALQAIPDQMQELIDNITPRCAALGKMILKMRAGVIVASSNQTASAAEMALRFKEMAFFPAQSGGLVEFLHNGIGYLDAEVLTILLAPSDRTRPYTRRLAQITQIIKSPLLAIVDEDDQSVAPQADGVIRIPQVHVALKPLLYAIPAQLLPYFTAVADPEGNPDIHRTDRTAYARAYSVAFPPQTH